MKQLINHLLFLSLFLLVACGSEELEVNFTINDRDLLPDREIIGTPDIDSPDNYVLTVNPGQNLKLIDQTTPERSVEKRFWFLDGREIGPPSGPSIFSHRATMSGIQTVKLCINEVKPANCVQKFIHVNVGPPEPVTPAPEPAPDVTSPPIVSSGLPVAENNPVTPQAPGSSVDEAPVYPPKPEDGGKSLLEPEPKDPPEEGEGDSKDLPPPPSEKKELTTSATTGFNYKDFSANCGAFVANGSLTISPQQDVELRAVVIRSDNCGSLRVTLRGAGETKSLAYSLSGATQTINLRDFRTRLQKGQTYTLSLTTSGSSDCEDPSLKPGLGGMATCSASPRTRSEVELAYPDNLIFYDLQYYY
jgi:hypothetical protein